jgi:hypothetical protein
MRGSMSRRTGWLMLLVGVLGLLAVAALLMFFIGLSQDLSSLRFMGALNDALNAATSILSAVLACFLHPRLRKQAPHLSLPLLIAVWIGAGAHSYGSWLIMTDRSGVELSSYYYFAGNGLIGIWLWVLNRVSRCEAGWPSGITRHGLFTGGFLMIGLLGIYGILLQRDGDDFSPLVMVAGISFIGMGILYPIWCLQLGRWILSMQQEGLSVARG